MIENIFQQSLQAFARRKPFKPFTVELVSGDRFVVDHPEALAQREAVAVYIDREVRRTKTDGRQAPKPSSAN